MATSDVSEVHLQFEVTGKDQAEQVAATIRERLGGLDESGVPQVRVEEPRVGLGEALVIISAVVTIAGQGADLINAVRSIVQATTGLVRDLRDLKNAFVEVGTKRIPVDQLVSEEDMKAASREAKPER
jgi:hypothetical protein